MNKTDRLLAIVLELQHKGNQRAEDLAATFETSVRTIYRDMQALSEAGVPVIGAPGHGYSLMDGYFLPPVSFTAEEAVTLLIGLDFVEQQFDADSRLSASAGRRKIEAVLPEPVRLEAERQRTEIRLIVPKPTRLSNSHSDSFVLLRQAIRDRRRIGMIYDKEMKTPFRTAHSSEQEDTKVPREIDPYGLIFVRGVWMLVGYCHLRKDLRHFRLNRIQELHLLNETYEVPFDFNLQHYVKEDDRNLMIRLFIQPELAGKVKEQHYFYIDHMEEKAEGLLVTLRVRELEEILYWVLGWGSGAEVLEPESLKQRVRLEAEKMLKRY